MPYKLRKAPKRELYWVVNKDTGKKHSIEPLPLERAKAQMKALYAAEGGYEMRGKGDELVGGMKMSDLATMGLMATALVPGAMLMSKALKGRGAISDRNILQQVATQSYQDQPSPSVGDLQLITATPTLKFYKRKNDNTIIVGIRGTRPTDAADVKADALIGIGQLQSSDRFKRDLQTLQQFQTQYPPSQFDYYGVGHSLGGAILDAFLRMGLLKNGVSYNPAVQPGDFTAGLANQRIYNEEDPLYKIMGKNVPGVEVRKAKPKSFLERLAEKIPYAGKAYNLYKAHQLDNFVGGAKPSDKFRRQLESEGINPSSYLKEAQRRAKAHGYGKASDLLGFADDGIHKLAIPDDQGRMVKFGRVGYRDHLIWSHREASGKEVSGTAKQKQSRFHKSHKAIKGDWEKNPFSPNNLAIRILW